MPWKRVGDPMVGPPGTVDVATITTLAAGAAPTAIVSGTPAARKLELGWPAIAESQIASAFGATLHVAPAPPASPTKFGLPVIWIDTRSKTSWPVPPPLRNETTLSFIIPDDEGVQYRVSGVDKAPGSYPNPVGTSWNITAHAKAGYVLATGSVTSWTLVLTGVTGFPDLDTMIAADAPTHFVKMVGGSMTDTGSTPIAWTGTGVTPDAWGIYSPAGAKVSSPATATAGIAGGLASWTVEFMVDLVTVTPPGNPGMPLINNGGALSVIVGWNGTITLRTSLAEYNSGVSIDRPAGTMTDKLTHVCITVGGGTLTLYLNGVSVGTGTGYTTSASNTLGTTFMPGPAAVPLGTSGRLAIYRGKALTAARVLQHAQAAGVAS